ncbi:TPA: hypothetical protein HA241_05395 [Candidatus Woesearchaeota archaeon]|nr:hypothetical protein [Candidatus Woesearchaeota archaeon]
MGKLLLGILFVFFIFVLSCTPPPPGGSGEDTALAGQAVAGRTTCKDTRVDTCVETEGSITYTMSGVFKTLTNFCSGKRVVDYSCSRKDLLRLCNVPCSASQTCIQSDATTAKCVPLCGNGKVDAGETCSSCPRDVRCAASEQCQTGVCTPICEDSDGGPNLLEKGTTKGINGMNPQYHGLITATDFCSSPYQVVEYFCQNNTVVYKNQSGTLCPYESGCQNGSCVPFVVINTSSSPTYNRTLTCRDSDEGLNYFRYGNIYTGQCSYIYSDGGAGGCRYNKTEDFCLSSQIVTEYYCDGLIPRGINYTCPSDSLCQNGACVQNELCESETISLTLPLGIELSTFRSNVSSQDLPTMFGKAIVINGQAYHYSQTLFLGKGRIAYIESDNDILDYHFFVPYDFFIGSYLLQFQTLPNSVITEKDGIAISSGTVLKDFEDTSISLFGKEYFIIRATRPNSQGSIKLELMTGSVKDTLSEGEQRTYQWRDYVVTIISVDEEGVRFSVNGENTSKLLLGDIYTLNDRVVLGVSDILFQNYVGGIHSATFYLNAEKVELRDDQINTPGGYNDLKINNKSFGDSGLRVNGVKINGIDNNITFSLSSLEVNMTSEDEYFVERLSTLKEAIRDVGEEEAVLFPGSWNIRFRDYNPATQTGTLEIGKICLS